MLPDNYLSPNHLPFNRSCLDEAFVLSTPDADPGGDGYWLLLQKGCFVHVASEDGAQLPFGAQPLAVPVDGALYIGQWQGAPCRLVHLAGDLVLPPSLRLCEVAAPEPEVGIALLSLAGLGRQLLNWQANSRFCSRCGGEQATLPAEWGVACRQCGAQHYPHIHPCVIVIVRRPGEILMTRKAEWPENRYSLVAGFLDMGESLEEAVVREVREETGVEIGNLRYIGSQSWPFPSQLMAGFVADYTGGEIVIEEKELEDVRWFPVDDLPSLPPKRSISRYLIDKFKNQE